MNIFGCIANLFISNDTRQTQSGSEIRGTAPWNLPFLTATPCVYPQVRFWPFERYVFKSKIWAPFTVPFTPSLPSCFYPQVMCPLCHCNSSSAEEPSGLKCILRNRFVFSYFQFVFWLKQTNLPRSWVWSILSIITLERMVRWRPENLYRTNFTWAILWWQKLKGWHIALIEMVL